jgi:4-amino-4-deoxy-L-arabinose transferase-like glycosyltransferase
MYHFMRWVDGPRPARHAFAVAAFFVLGFMTKFVAMLFLPIVGAVLIAVSRVVRQRFVVRWPDWVAPTAVAVALIAPWFVYEWLQHGRLFVEVIFGTHVYQRFTGALDPTHLAPWHFYFSRTWMELNGARVAAVVAVTAFIVGAWRGRDWRFGLVLAWWLVPLALMSLGTSKLFHYAYPFLPPLALIVGWGAAQLVAVADADWGRRMAAQVARIPAPSSLWVRTALLVAAGVVLSFALVTAINGRIVWRFDGVRLLQNSSAARPLLLGAFLLAFAGRASASIKVLPAIVLAVVLPVRDYPLTASRVDAVDAPLRVIRDCAASVAASKPGSPTGVYNTARLLSHSVYYYLFRLGPWTEGDFQEQDELRRRLLEDGHQTLVVLTHDGYEQMRRLAVERSIVSLPPAVVVEDLVIAMPGPFSGCATSARAAGAQPPAPQS